MNAKNHRGFTIVELTLVLAISSLLLLLMMTGITLAVQRQRFSDSVNGTQGFLQQQFNQTQNTINNRPTGSCDPTNPGNPSADVSGRGASGCLVLGKLFDIEASTGDDESIVTAYNVIGTDVDVDDDAYRALDDLTLIRTISPTAIKQTDLDERYIVPWGAHITDIKDDLTKAGTHPVRYIAMLRSPRSGVIHIYKIRSVVPLAADSTRLSMNGSDDNISEIENESVKMCLSSVDLANYNAMLEIKPAGSQDSITTHFDDAQKEAYQCS